MFEENKKMPTFPTSYWREVDLPTYSQLTEDQEVDVAIVGGGITGITAGYLLAKEGLRVVIIEAGKILSGTTGHTTAKITAQHGLIYDELIHHFGEEQARQYYRASDQALAFIRGIVKEHKIDCDFSDQDATIYATSDEYAGKIRTEATAYEKLGIKGSMISSIPFDIPIKNGLVLPNQAQFHPLKYLAFLADLFVKAGGIIYENTTAKNVDDGEEPVVLLRDGGKIKCKDVIVASHYPFIDKKGLLFTRVHVERSYIIGIKSKKPFPGGMYISSDTPTRSLRSTPIAGEELILVGGEGHKTGQGIDTMKHYLALEQFADKVLGIGEYKYRWSAQDIVTLDKVPYIGPVTEDRPHVLVATGYRKWGMTNGTAAALLLTDRILKKTNPYEELYTIARFHSDPEIKKFISTNADVAKHLLKGKLEFVAKDPTDLENDEGAVVMVNGQRAGAYKDHNGELHLVDTTCTHLGCEVEWNHGDRTWDCPCHGSRYSIDGEVLNGPTNKPLKKVDF